MLLYLKDARFVKRHKVRKDVSDPDLSITGRISSSICRPTHVYPKNVSKAITS